MRFFWFTSWTSWNLPYRKAYWNRAKAWIAHWQEGIEFDTIVYGLSIGPLTVWAERYGVPVPERVRASRRRWMRLNTVAWDVWRKYQAPDDAPRNRERLDRLDRIFERFGYQKPIRNGYGGYYGHAVWY